LTKLVIGGHRSRRRGSVHATHGSQAGRNAIFINAGVRVVLPGICGNVDSALGDAVRKSQVVTSHVAVQLEAGVAVDVPAEADTWFPLVVFVDKGDTLVVVVDET